MSPPKFPPNRLLAEPSITKDLCWALAVGMVLSLVSIGVCIAFQPAPLPAISVESGGNVLSDE